MAKVDQDNNLVFESFCNKVKNMKPLEPIHYKETS